MAKRRQDRTTAYARLVVSRKRLCGRSEYLACQRHLEDMENKEFFYIFDAKEAEKHIDIANELTIAEGEEKKPLKTRGFQNFIIGSLFGWRKKRSKERRFREAYIQMGRQNGKSFLSGELANDFATFSGYELGNIYCTATKQDQAKIVWKEVNKFIQSDTELKALYKVREYDNTIISLVTGTEIKAIGRDTKSADGFRSILAIIDEYHAHTTNQMYKLMLDGQFTVNSALTLAITTAGFNLKSACYEQYKFSKKVLERAINKESLFIYIAEMDKEDDIWDRKNWAKANPLHLWQDDETLNLEMLARMAEKAIDAREKKGADLLNFKTKSLNVWVTFAGGALIDLEKWRICRSKKTIKDMKGRECYLGIDLSSGGDLTSIALIFPLEDEKVYIYSHSFMPELRLQEHETTDEAPYRIWVEQGLLTLTSGMYGIKTDYKYIISHLKELIEKHDLQIIGVGYDNHNASAFLSDLEETIDCDLTEIVQSAKSLNDSTKDFQLSVKAGQVEYDEENALLSWSIANAIITENSFKEIKVDKNAQENRIDPVDAILDAWKVMFLNKKDDAINTEEMYDAWEKIMQAQKDTEKGGRT